MTWKGLITVLLHHDHHDDRVAAVPMHAVHAADDGADLLGNNELPVLHRPPSSSGFSWLQSILILFISLGLVTTLVWCFTDNRSYYMRWREEKYRKRVRRKYGIPDSDHDVFNVAYANAKRREEEAKREAEALSARKAQAIVAAPILGSTPSSSGLRLRGAPGPQASHGVVFPADISGQEDLRDRVRSERPPQSPVKPRSIPGERTKPESNEAKVDAEPSLSPGKRSSVGENKRARSDSEEDELMNMDVDALADMSQPKSKRGSKRHAGTDDDATPENGRKKVGKRPRRISRRTQDLLLDLEDQERGDNVMELDEFLSRGKKRDRAEAGSTFGGDDDSPGTRGRKTRRKRRSTAHAEVATESERRGTKRVLDVESTLDSDEDDRISGTKSFRKRGKHIPADGDSSTDMSLDGPAIAIDPSCAGHKVGDEWVVNGQLFKVGPDGKRLRQVLVKKKRSRYSMPTDSQHPDSQAQMVVLMETWLNDEDFNAAEERGDVFSTKKPDEEAEVEPVKTGKTLLWTSTKNNVSPKKAFKDSIVANVGPASNPFDRPAYNSYGRRVSTGHDAFKQSTRSPILTPSKSYSKWEKQDLEAEAMAKLRQKLDEQKKQSLATSEIKKKVTFNLPTSTSAPASTSSVADLAGDKSSSTEATSTPKDTFATPSNNLFIDPSKSAQPLTSSASTPSLSAPSASGGGGFFTPSANKTLTEPAPIKPPVPSFFTPTKDRIQEATSTPAVTPQEPSRPAVPSFSFSKPADPAPPASTSFFSSKTGITSAPSANPPPASAPLSFPSSTAGSSMFTIKGAAQSANNTGSSVPPNPFPSSSPAATAPSSSGFSFAPNPNPSSNPAPQPPPAFSFSNSSKSTSSTDAIKAAAASTSTSTVPSSTPKFSFGFSKQDPPSTSGTPTASIEPVKSGFSFGPPSAGPASSASKFAFPSSGSSSNPTPPTSGSKPPFSFSPAANSTTPSSTPSASTSLVPSSSTTTPSFSFNFGAPKSDSQIAPPTGSNPFGANSKQSSTPATPFGNTPKPADAPKPLFGFGSGGSGSTPAAITTPAIATPSAAAEKTDKPVFSFNFGSNSSTTQGVTNGTSSSAASNPFGAKPAGTSSPFSFGAPPNGSSNTNLFGKPADGSTHAANVFGGGSGSIFGNAQQKS